MRLGGRQKKIVEMLRLHPATGQELSHALHVSRRTIMRDVVATNRILTHAKAGYIESDPIYHLRIDSVQNLNDLLANTIDEVSLVLLALLLTETTTLGELSDALNLPATTVRMAVDEANKSFSQILSINIEVGKGLSLTLKRSKRVDLISALAVRDNVLMEALKKEAEPYLYLASAERLASYVSRMRPWLSSGQGKLQFFAAIAAALHGSQQVSESYVDDNLVALIGQKTELHTWLLEHRYEVIGLAADLLSLHGVAGSRSDLPSLIFEHIARAAVFPTLMSSSFKMQLGKLRMEHPFEFDFAHEFSQKLESMRDDLIIEPDLCALYVISTSEHHGVDDIRVLLLSTRRSLSSVNRSMLEQALGKITIDTVYSAEEALLSYQQAPYDLLVRDDSSYGEALDQIPWDISYNGILSDVDISKVRDIVLDASYKNSLSTLLPPTHFVSYEPSDENPVYLDELSRALELFVDGGVMTTAEAEAVVKREAYGERLQFGDIAIPHCVTTIPSQEFRIFCISPAKVLHDADEDVSLILIVLASQTQQDKSSIFSYLHSVLGGLESIHPHMTYEQVIELLQE